MEFLAVAVRKDGVGVGAISDILGVDEDAIFFVVSTWEKTVLFNFKMVDLYSVIDFKN